MLSEQRRQVLATLGAAAGGLWASACSAPNRASRAAPTEVPAGVRLVGEFEPMQAVWLGYDAGHLPFTAALARALAPHVPLRMLLSLSAHEAAARALLTQAGVDMRRVRFDIEPQAIYFLRDAAVFCCDANHQLGVVDFQWSQYGLAAWCQRRHETSPERAGLCAGPGDAGREALDERLAELAGARLYPSTLYLEGGGIEVNGRGVALVSERFVRQRNPGVGKTDLEAAFLALPGITRLVWLAEGLASDPHLRGTITGDYVAWGTGGHTDEFVRFADARTVLLAWPDDAEVATHPVARLNRQRMQRNFELLTQARDQDGQPLRILKVPMPRSIERRVFLSAAADASESTGWTADFFPPSERRREGKPVIQVASSSYLNFVIANGVVVVPGYEAHGTPRAVEQRVRALFEQVFPGRQIAFIDALGANWVGGGPHCATLNEPAVQVRTGASAAVR